MQQAATVSPPTVLPHPSYLHFEKFCNVSSVRGPPPQPTANVEVSIAKWDLIFLSLSAICQMNLAKARRNGSAPLMMEYPDNQYIRKSDILEKILINYDTSLRPIGKSGKGPVEVDVNVRIKSIENINDFKMEYTVQMIYRQSWFDRRLRYSHIPNNFKYIQMQDIRRIWMPDIFFSNEVTGYLHRLMLPNVYTRIFPNGQVMTSSRITLLLSCSMDLHHYPLDKQSCKIVMGSYGWATKDLLLAWADWNAVEIDRGIAMPSFNLMSFANETCANSVTSSGNYSCINLRLEFERQFGYYLIQVYIPCVMVVAVSWLSFWLGPSAADARISLCVTTILTVVTATYGLNQIVPPASYIKAIDVWTFAIQFMVFASIIEFAYVNYVVNFQWKKALKILADDDMGDREEILQRQGELKATRIDSLSKVLFPGGFGIFNIVYWAVYLTASSSDTDGNQLYHI